MDILFDDELIRMFPQYWEMHAQRLMDTFQELLKHTTSPTNSNILDVGVFPGFLAASAVKSGFSVSGVSNEEMTPSFRSHMESLGVAIEVCDIESDRIPFNDSHFDAVLFTEVIEHLHRDPFQPLDEIFRVLKPGGVLIVTTPNLARWQVIFGLIKGQSCQPDIQGDFYEAFPVNPNYKHCREYTCRELKYILNGQNKRLYRYDPVRITYVKSWDPSFRDLLRSWRWMNKPFETSFGWIASTVVPAYRSNMVAVAQRPNNSMFIEPDSFCNVSGFHELEVDTESGSTHRYPYRLPFRWTNGEARFMFDLPDKLSKNARIRFMVGSLAPAESPPLQCTVFINDKKAGEFNATPSKALRSVDLPLPVDDTTTKLELYLTSTTWKPREFGIPDDRILGLILSWGPILIYGSDENSANM
jgi:SAM-dependent methyltransferase